MKKILFFISFSLFLVSCATNGFYGKGSGPATKTKGSNISTAYYKVKKDPKTSTIVKSKKEKKNGRYGNGGVKAPKPTRSNVE